MILKPEQILLSRTCVERTTGISLPFAIQVKPTDSNNLSVTLCANDARIEASNINSLTRGFFILARAKKEGIQKGSWNQHKHFSSCGTMLDMSRNAVMRVEAVKRHID